MPELYDSDAGSDDDDDDDDENDDDDGENDDDDDLDDSDGEPMLARQDMQGAWADDWKTVCFLLYTWMHTTCMKWTLCTLVLETLRIITSATKLMPQRSKL